MKTPGDDSRQPGVIKGNSGQNTVRGMPPIAAGSLSATTGVEPITLAKRPGRN